MRSLGCGSGGIHAGFRARNRAAGKEDHEEGRAHRTGQLLEGVHDGRTVRVEFLRQRGQRGRHERGHHQTHAQGKEHVHAHDHPQR